MTTRREVIFQGAAATLAPVGADRWAIPSDDEIRRLLADRVDVQKRGVGIVVGVIAPEGRRVVAYGARADALFQIGSVSKVFATLLLADMVVRGEVKFDDPAAMYLPDGVTMPERGRPITLADLATHMSGLPSMPTNFDLRGRPDPISAYAPSQLWAFLSTYRPDREPGAAWSYSNLGVSLLGRLLGRRMGVDYETLLRTRVLQPLGLSDTAITLTADQQRRVAPGHDLYRKPIDSWEMRTLQASGSLRSTADDLLEFLAAYMGYRETPLAAAMALQTNYPRPATGPNQRLGWAVRRDEARNETDLLHDGGKAGYRSLVVFNPQARTGVVVLANMRSDDNLAPLALHLLSGRKLSALPPVAPEPPTVRLPRKALDACAGRYRLASDTILAVGRRGDRLLLDVLGFGALELVPDGERTFFSRESDLRLLFEAGDDGRMKGAVLREGGNDQPAVRLD